MHIAFVKIEFLVKDLHVGVISAENENLALKDIHKIIKSWWSIHCWTVTYSDHGKAADH